MAIARDGRTQNVQIFPDTLPLRPALAAAVGNAKARVPLIGTIVKIGPLRHYGKPTDRFDAFPFNFSIEIGTHTEVVHDWRARPPLTPLVRMPRLGAVLSGRDDPRRGGHLEHAVPQAVRPPAAGGHCVHPGLPHQGRLRQVERPRSLGQPAQPGRRSARPHAYGSAMLSSPGRLPVEPPNARRDSGAAGSRCPCSGQPRDAVGARGGPALPGGRLGVLPTGDGAAPAGRRAVRPHRPRAARRPARAGADRREPEPSVRAAVVGLPWRQAQLSRVRRLKKVVNIRAQVHPVPVAARGYQRGRPTGDALHEALQLLAHQDVQQVRSALQARCQRQRRSRTGRASRCDTDNAASRPATCFAAPTSPRRR